jgi:hypothetical protein
MKNPIDEAALMSRELQVAEEIDSFVNRNGKYPMWMAFTASSDMAIREKTSMARAWDVWTPDAAKRILRFLKEKGMHLDRLNHCEGKWICIY